MFRKTRILPSATPRWRRVRSRSKLLNKGDLSTASMSQPNNKPTLSIINPARVRYIKLGSGGIWERECLDQGITRMGFGTESTERFLLCESRNWAGLVRSFISEGKDKGTAARFTNE